MLKSWSLRRVGRSGWFWVGLWALIGSGLTAAETGWQDLFDGRTLQGWRAAESPASFRVVGGTIEGVGPRAHLFYEGKEQASSWENFELELEFKAEPGANSGVFFHTAWQDESWPNQGLEVQINNSQPRQGNYLENKKTGSLYGVRNTYRTLVADGAWATLRVLVTRPRVQIWVNGVKTVDYTEPLLADTEKLPKRLGKGTFALQCHDAASRVNFRALRVRALPATTESVPRSAPDEFAQRVFYLAKENFPLVNLSTAAPASATETEAVLARSFATGFGVGVLAEGLREAKDSEDFLARWRTRPVLTGLAVTAGDATASARARTQGANFHYVLGRVSPETTAVLSGPLPSGEAADPARIALVQLIQEVPIDVCVWPTFSGHDTQAELRLEKVLQACAQEGVALLLDPELGAEAARVVRQAKAAGVKLALGSATEVEPARWLPMLRVIEQEKLQWSDFWLPGHGPNRAARTR